MMLCCVLNDDDDVMYGILLFIFYDIWSIDDIDDNDMMSMIHCVDDGILCDVIYITLVWWWYSILHCSIMCDILTLFIDTIVMHFLMIHSIHSSDIVIDDYSISIMMTLWYWYSLFYWCILLVLLIYSWILLILFFYYSIVSIDGCISIQYSHIWWIWYLFSIYEEFNVYIIMCNVSFNIYLYKYNVKAIQYNI